jgi:Lrp/AsnC family leucine-responsive transcriptional regulator
MVVRHEAEHPKRTMHSFATVPLDAIVIVGVGWCWRTLATATDAADLLGSGSLTDSRSPAMGSCIRGRGRSAATGLSASACSRRLRRLEDRQLILGYRAIIDPEADGRGLTAFVAVRLVRHQREHIQRFHEGTRKIAEVVECHHVTGNFDYLLRVAVPDLPAYERFHADKLAALHNVGQVVTYISMTDSTDA